MKDTYSEKHFGQALELAIRRSNTSISQLSRKLGVSRRSIYNWFEKQYLPVDLILQVGESINYDFSNEFPNLAVGSAELQKHKSAFEKAGYVDTASFWKGKYYNLLENHRSLINKQF